MSIDEIHAVLCRLRDAARGEGMRDRRREQSDWRSVDAWIRRQRTTKGSEGDDVAQEALIAIARRIGDLDARDPASAAAWLSRIARHKQIDVARVRAREGKRVEPVGDEEATDAIARDDAGHVDNDALARLTAIVEEAITTHVATLELAAADRQMRRMQARASLHRVLGASQSELRAALALEDSMPGDRLHKWVERGRPILAAALEAEAGKHESPARELLERLREVALERRADAGIARPSRRKKAVTSVGGEDG